jgi:hypothetical protein
LALVAQADSRRPVAKATTPAKRFRLFIFDPFVLADVVVRRAT